MVTSVIRVSAWRPGARIDFFVVTAVPVDIFSNCTLTWVTVAHLHVLPDLSFMIIFLFDALKAARFRN
jgi:hypothetical protein